VLESLLTTKCCSFRCLQCWLQYLLKSSVRADSWLQLRCWTCPQFFQLSNFNQFCYCFTLRSDTVSRLSRQSMNLPRLSCFQSQEQKTARPVLVRFSFIELLLGVVGQMPQVAKFRSPSAWWSSANLPGTPGLAKDVGNWAASSSVQIGHAKDVQLQTSGDKTSLPNGPSWVAWVDYVNFKAFKFLLIDLIVDVSIVELMIIDVCL
jgi:hypothetical protein